MQVNSPICYSIHVEVLILHGTLSIVVLITKLTTMIMIIIMIFTVMNILGAADGGAVNDTHAEYLPQVMHKDGALSNTKRIQ